ncbi:MAG: DUF7352 domain-containing protein [Planctomycetota bacterium]|jgi:hypothetical protein
MLTIQRYMLDAKEAHIQMPVGAKVLAVQMDLERARIWAEIDTQQKKMKERIFRIISTGEEIDFENREFVGTFQTKAGVAYHLYEVVSVDA